MIGKPVYDATDVGLAVQYFTCSLQLVFKTHAPYIEKRAKGGLCPRLDIDAIKLMDRPDQTSRKARKSKSNDDLKTYRILRNKCNKKIKKAKSSHLKEALNDNINKQKKFRSQIKSVFPRKSQSMANVSTDERPILNMLSRFYSTMALKLKKSTYLLTDSTWRYTAKSPHKTTIAIRFPCISVLFVQKELQLLKTMNIFPWAVSILKMLEDHSSSTFQALNHLLKICAVI